MSIDEMQQRLAASGATMGEVAGVPVARHFGDGAGEYRAVRESMGIAHRSDLALFRMWGRDPVKMLQGLITNDVQNAPSGRATYGAMLTPKGRMIADLRSFVRPTDDAPELMFDVAREAAEGVAKHLGRFVPPMFSRWENTDDGWTALGVYGPRSRELLNSVFEDSVDLEAEDEYAWLDFGGGQVLVLRTAVVGGEEGYDLWMLSDSAPLLWDRLMDAGEPLGGRPVGYGALDTLRIEAGRPRYGRDMSEETIATEAYESSGLMERAISFNKGCYTGQEVIVRIAHRGRVNRHLRGLLMGESGAPDQRTEIFREDSDRAIGWTTSVAFSPLREQTVALGYVRREVEPGGRVRLGSPDGPEVEVTGLPF